MSIPRSLRFLLAAAAGLALLPATAQHLSGVKFEPLRPTTAQPVVAQVSGHYPAAAFKMAADPKVTVNGEAISIELLALPPSGMSAQVMVPYTVPVPLGVLPAGSYNATVKLSFKGLPMPPQLASGSFKVVAP